jgi:hypothetical protein
MTSFRFALLVACSLIGCSTKSNPLYGVSEGGSTSGSGSATSGNASSTTALPPDAGGGSSGTGTGDTPLCEGMMVAHETFDGPPAEPPWETQGNIEQMMPVIDSGELRLVADIPTGLGPANWQLFWAADVPIQGHTGFELVDVPTSADHVQIFVQLLDADGDAIYIEFLNTGLLVTSRVVEGNRWDPLVQGVWNSLEQRWVRLNFDRDAGLVGADVSPDGQNWSPYLEPVTPRAST